jgi:hypothetical protein
MFLNDPLFDIVDSVGRPISGAQAYFYLTSTLTLTDTYTTSALSVANANPVVADSAGRFPPIYLDPTVSYRLRVFDAAGVLVSDRDPIAQGNYFARLSATNTFTATSNIFGAGSGMVYIDINGGSVAAHRYYSAGVSKWAVGYAAASGSGNNFQWYSYGSATTAMELDAANNNLTVNGTIKPVGATTTASAANAFMDAGNGNALIRSTSSRRYKTDIEPLNPAYAERVLQLEPIWYRSTSEADRTDWSWFGLIAEDVAAIEPRLVHWMQDGDSSIPDGVQYERLSVLLLAVVKQMRAELDALKAGQAPVAATFTEAAIPAECAIYVQPDESIADLKIRLLTELTRLRSMAVGRLDMTDAERSMLTTLEGQVAQRWFTS